MKLDFKVDIKELTKNTNNFINKNFYEIMHEIIEKICIDITGKAKEIVQDKAHDTGEFVQSIDYKIVDELKEKGTIKFKVFDGVKYGKYWEFGTIAHWVPFWNKQGEPVLADWGHRHGFSEEEMKKMKGLMVEIPELMPFKRALLYGFSKMNNNIIKTVRKYQK